VVTSEDGEVVLPSVIPRGKVRSAESNSESTSSGGVVTPASNRVTQSRLVVTIVSFRLVEKAGILSNPDIRMLYVEYQLLGRPQEELETPFALPKPRLGQPIVFNFTKVFHVGEEETNLLRTMMSGGDSSDSGRIPFTIVSEPLEQEEDLECEDVGYASIDLKQVMQKGEDLIDVEIPVHDSNTPDRVMGYLTVSVEALRTLQAIQHT